MTTAQDFTEKLIGKKRREAFEAIKAGDDLRASHLLAEVARLKGGPAAAPTAIGTAWRALPAEYLAEPPAARRWLLQHPATWGEGGGDGLLPLGKAGVLSSAGGGGKTGALLSLGTSLRTGRPWLGHFVVPPEARHGRVLLALAEEDEEEVHRRLWDVATALELTAAERASVVDGMIVLPLAGRPVSLLTPGADGRSVTESAELLALRARLAADGPWSLVALDPLARWAGPDTEADNAAATRLVQAVESLTEAPGNPTVLLAHHSSKAARDEGRANSRGVTALTDGLRWEGTLNAKNGAVFFQQAKSNYSRPMEEPLRLVRGPRGVLRVPTAAEDREAEARADAAAEDRLTADVHRVVMALRKEGEATSIDAIVALATMKAGPGRAAVRLAITRGLIVQGGTARAPIFTAPTTDDVPGRVCEDTPIPPGTSGRPRDGRPGRPGTPRDAEGRRDVESGSRSGARPEEHRHAVNY